MRNVVIIGAGVSGCAVARELSRKKLNITVLEKGADVCEGTSKANSGIAHAGFDAKPGTLMARLNLRGSEMMEELSHELQFAYIRNGSLVLCFDEKELPKLQELKARGEQNGVKELRIIDREELVSLEPEVGDGAVAALYAPTGAIVDPFGLNIALAENAADNGAAFRFYTEVTAIDRADGGYLVHTDQGDFAADVVINTAGVYADAIHNMICEKGDELSITPRRGEYQLLDNKVGNLVSHTLFQLPTALGKGVLVTPTVHGNLLLGPTAEDLPDKEGTNTSADGLSDIINKAALSVKKVPSSYVITSFAGLRAHGERGDFIIEEVKGAKGFFDVAAIESPGLTSAPAIGEYVAEMVCDYLHPEEKEHFIRTRQGMRLMAMADSKTRKALIAENPAYANVICRCAMVTEGEMMEAIHRTLGATTTDGIKRRTSAGMGRCQAGFCLPRTVEILSRELGVAESEIVKTGKGSSYLLSESAATGKEADA